MTLRITTSAAVDSRITKTLRWWAENREKAPEALAEEIAAASALIRDYPDVGAVVRGTRRRGVRVIHMQRVPYDLYYRRERDTIRILALWHSHRRPPRL